MLKYEKFEYEHAPQFRGWFKLLRKRQLWYICTRFLGPLSRSNCHLLNMVVFLHERRLFLGSHHYNHSTWRWYFLLLTFPSGIFPFHFTFLQLLLVLGKILFLHGRFSHLLSPWFHVIFYFPVMEGQWFGIFRSTSFRCLSGVRVQTVGWQQIMRDKKRHKHER